MAVNVLLLKPVQQSRLQRARTSVPVGLESVMSCCDVRAVVVLIYKRFGKQGKSFSFEQVCAVVEREFARPPERWSADFREVFHQTGVRDRKGVLYELVQYLQECGGLSIAEFRRLSRNADREYNFLCLFQMDEDMLLVVSQYLTKKKKGRR